VSAPRPSRPSPHGTLYQCRRCERWLPRSSFYKGGGARSVCGISSRCKLCARATAVEWQAQHAEDVRAYNRGYGKTYVRRDRRTDGAPRHHAEPVVRGILGAAERLARTESES